ncbi:MAG: hypothetical protein JWL76_1567 [Thermoleophilia bacterium]|nr:hypothetical protein [Thermoleophilia bacterium]
MLLATVLVALLVTTATAALAAPAARTAAPEAAAATPVPRIVTRSIRCATTVSSTRRLTATQRAQLRRFGAFKSTRKVGRRTSTIWTCIRTARQARVVRSLIRKLGTPTTDLDAMVVSFPRTLDGRLDIALPGGKRASWDLQGAPQVPAQAYRLGAVYSTTEYDVVQQVGWGSLKESIAVHRSQGVRTWRWKLSWKGGKGPVIAADGSLHYGADVVLAKPFLQNAAGRRIKDLEWKLDGDLLSVTIDDRGIALPYVLDPASSYPQWLYPSPAYVPGSGTVNGLFGTPPGGLDTGTSIGDVDEPVGSEYMFWSNGNTTVPEAAPVTNATHPLPVDGNPPLNNGAGLGQFGWAQESLGGVTLPLGPYSAQARIQVTSATANPLTLAVKARIWKGLASPSDAVFTEMQDAPAPVALTDWVQSAPVVFALNNQISNITIPNMTVNPGTNILGVSDHVFVEYALVVLDTGANNTNVLLHTNSLSTFINFGAATTNTPGVAANQRLSAPTTISATGWTNDSTPRLRADLDDPDWYHHINYQICSNATCATVVQTGNSTFGQTFGGATNDWTSPALADGTYYMRGRTVEDDSVFNGDDQIGAWNNFTATSCAAPDVGACGQFRIDTVLPNGAITAPATGSWNRGTVAVSGTASDAASGVATHSLQWRRITPSPAGPLPTGVTCAGASSPTWACSWDTTAVIDGDYELQLTVTDVAGNVRVVASNTYKVDNTAPAWPGGSFWRDGAAAGDLTWVNSLTTLGSNWSAATDSNTVAKYEYCLSTSPSGSDCAAGATKVWTNNALVLNQTSGGLTLTEGGLYYSCVRANDPAGNASTVQCSNGQTVDTLLPTLPTVNDGTAADITWINQTNTPASTVQANWSGGGDIGSGVNRWEYCITTSASGADCAGGALRTWTTNALATSVSAAPIATTEGTQYFACVRVYDNAGNPSAGSACSNGQRKDTVSTPALAANTVLDSLAADIDVQSNATTLNANWPTVVDPAPASGLLKYQYCITTTAGGADCAGAATVAWTDTAPLTGTSLTRSGLALADGTTYRVCIRSWDLAGNAVSGSSCSDGVLIDGIPPVWPAGASRDGVGPVTDVVWTTSLSTLSSHWSAATDANGIGSYDYCLSTSATGADCAGGGTRSWTGNALALTETSNALSLVHATTYYSCVRATDNAGNTGATLCSNGQTVDAVEPTVPPAVNDGTGADLTWLQSLTTASANWPGGSDALSGLNRWEYCISTLPSCAGTIAKNWTSTGVTAAQTSAGLTLVQGQAYYTTVRGYDNAGNGGTMLATSNSQRVDTVGPTASATVNDSTGADTDFQSSTTTLSANWAGVTDPAPGVGFASGVDKYQFCITTTAAGTDCAGAATLAWTDNVPLGATSVTRAGLTLTNGSTYRVCVRAVDVATNNGALACSDGITIDVGPPTWLGTSRDGAGPGDVTWTTSTTTLLSNWDGATDPAGIDHYEYCLTTSPTGADCAATPTKGWTATGLTLNQSSGGLTLANGTIYYSCVRAYDTALNVTAPPLCSNGQRVDNVAPILPPAVLDGTGADIAWLQSLTTASANWPGGSDPLSGIASWEYCISTGIACSGTIVKNWTNNVTAITETSAALALVQGELYYTTVRGTDVAGNATPGTVSSDGQRVDTIAPPVPATINDGTGADVGYTSSPNTLSANWSAVADPAPGVGVASGLQKYQYCITTIAGGANCAAGALVTWADNAPLTATTLTRSGLALVNGTTYYVCVRGVDVATNAAATGCTNGISIDLGPPTANWTSWTEPAGNLSNYLYSPGGNLLWFNPAPSGPVDPGVARATVTASDPGAGMDRVDFPNLGAGAAWGAGGSDNVVGAANTWTWDYAFSGSGAIGDPALNNATAYDTGGAATGSPALDFDIRPDSLAPTSPATVPPMTGLQNTVTYPQSVPLGTDADSGIGRWIMDVQTAPLTDNACGAWDPWVDGSSITGYSGPAVNGTTLNITHYLNDPNFDMIADYKDAFCWRTRVRVFDNVDNMTTIADNGFMKFDFGQPDVGFTGPPNGSAQSGTFAITGTADDVWPGSGIEYTNTGSGIDQVVVTYESPDGPDAGTAPDFTGNACPPIVAFGGPWTALTWSCSWNSTLPAMDGIYTIKIQSRDRAGNLSVIQTRTYLVDNIAPVRAWHSWNDYGSAAMHSVASVAWVNPNAAPGAYQLDARVTASDAGSNVNRVEFPGLGAGWTPAAGITNATSTSPVPVANAYTMSYTFANPGALAPPGAKVATAFDGAGNSGTVPFEVRLDGTAPTGMAASVVNGNQITANVAVTLGAGTEGALESGLGSWNLFVDTAPLTNDGCGAFANTWASVTSGVGIAPASYSHDVTALGSQCYRYRLDVTDNVGNVGQSTPTTARRVDLVAPLVNIGAPLSGSVQGGTFNVSGTASDVHTGIAKVKLTWTGPQAPGTGTICDPATLGGAYNAYTFTCSWATSTFADGTYTLTATSFDVAGNPSATNSISVLLDNFPPFVGFDSYNETSQYTHWAGPVGTNNVLWYNPTAPAGSYSFDVRTIASDPSGINRVEYSSAGAGWTGGMPASQTVPIGPANRYSQTYSFNTAGAVADPPTLNAKAFDATAVNNASTPFEFTPDSVLPAAGTVTNPNSYNPSTTIVVNVGSGGDGAGSGIQGWTLLRDTATLSAGTCITWSGYTTTVSSGAGTVAGTRNDVVADGTCARYRLLVTDNVGNVGTFTGTDVTKIDLTPPTGSITLAENTGTQWTYLANPTRLFVNTNAGTSGTFDANATAAAASGILDVTFPALAAGFTGNGVMPGPGPNFTRTYSWTGAAGAPPAGLNAAVRSNSLGSLNLPFEVISDAAVPVAATVTHPGGYTTSTALTVNYTAGNDGTGSGIAGYQLQRETGTLAGGVCSWSATWVAVGPAGGASYADTLAHATCYRYRVAATDNVGNVGFSPVSAARMVDTTAPTGASVTLAEGTNPGEQYLSAPDTIWVKAAPTGPINFTISVAATDPESGTGAAVFPALGSTFIYTSGGLYNGSYAWSPTATTPGVAPVVQVANGSGLMTTIPFTVNVDGAAPTGATLDQENGLITDFMVDLSYAVGGDGAGSGIATWRIERQSAPYTIATNTCGVWTSYATYPLPIGHPTSPYVDTSVVQPTCYRYRLVEVDNVGNVTNTVDAAGDIAKVIFDITPPTTFALNLPTNPALPAITTGQPAPTCGAVPTYATTTPAFSWTPSSDAESGLSHYDVYVDGVGAPDATVPAPATTWTTPALTEGAHSLGVRALDFQANFVNATPAYPTNIQVDTTPPSGSLNSPAMGSWSGDTTPTLDWNATDATCLTRVEVFLDGSASAAAVTSGTEGSWTPAAAMADGAHTWRFVAYDALGNAASFGPYSFGIDTIQPTAFAVTAPTAGQTVRGFVNVAWSASSDADSGLAPAAAYQVWVDGAIKATLPAGTTSTLVSGVTNGGHTVFVRALDLVGNTRDTAPVLFTGYGAIPVPLLDTPANGAATNVVPLLDWHWPSDGGPAPTSYNVWLDGVNVGSQVHPTTQHTLAADPGDGSHTWRIEQFDPYTAGSVTSVTRTFILDRTPPIVDLTLTRVATVVSWSAPTDPALPVASGIAYQEFWVDPAGPPAATSTTLTSANVSRDYGLLPDGTYTMWVRAYDFAGNFTDTPSLTVVNDSVPPTAFNLIAPAALPAIPAITNGAGAPTCESDPTYTSATPTLTWQASSDATSGLAGYDVYVDGVLATSVGAATTSYTVTAPLAGGTHTWRVVAKDNFGLTTNSTPSPMNVRVDAAAPTIAFASPAANSYTSDTTPAFSWTATDDDCLARIELTIGANVYVLTGATAGFSSPIVLPEGPTTWSLRAFDSAGRVTSAGAPRTINIDTIAPSGLTATFPGNTATVNEGMLTFSWSTGTDGGSGVAKYDLVVDGTVVATNLAGTSSGTYQILGGAVVGTTAPHNWSVKVYDNVGNAATFPFSFLALSVPDTTPPNAFDLLTPATGASIPVGTALTWAPSWDFKGVTSYRIYVDGNLIGTTAGNVTSFTPAAGAGSPICTVDFEASTSAGCLSGPTPSSGASVGGGVSPPSTSGATGGAWNTTTAAGWAAGGTKAYGVGDQSLPTSNVNSGFDGDRVWTAVSYQASIPASGGDIRVEHRYNMHAKYLAGEVNAAYDGGAIELMVDDEHNGFTDDAYLPTCEYNAFAIYGASLQCAYEIIENAGGPHTVMGGNSAAEHPIYKQNAFSGDSAGIVQTKLKMATFAGMDVRIRFRIGTDGCFKGMATAVMPYPDYAVYCDDASTGAPGYFPAQWRIDNITLANSSLLPGVHNWYVEARDAAGNVRQSNQTWSFNLL